MHSPLCPEEGPPYKPFVTGFSVPFSTRTKHDCTMPVMNVDEKTGRPTNTRKLQSTASSETIKQLEQSSSQNKAKKWYKNHSKPRWNNRINNAGWNWYERGKNKTKQMSRKEVIHFGVRELEQNKRSAGRQDKIFSIQKTNQTKKNRTFQLYRSFYSFGRWGHAKKASSVRTAWWVSGVIFVGWLHNYWYHLCTSILRWHAAQI